MRKKITRPANKLGKASQLRIIGGQWRSRRLPVASVPGLRPTPDRVRETLFNWLQMKVPGARCLDLFAGSGALGFEAASRGAADVVLIEKHPAAFKQLCSNIEFLNAADQVQSLHTDAVAFLQTTPQPFDVIFLDPPFHQDWLNQVMALILQHNLLSAGGMIYLEYEPTLNPDFSVWGMQIYREMKAGQVVSVLLS